jgi:hypothetical protein
LHRDWHFIAFALSFIDRVLSPASAASIAFALISMHLARQPVVLLPVPVLFAAASPPPSSQRELHFIASALSFIDRVLSPACAASIAFALISMHSAAQLIASLRLLASLAASTAFVTVPGHAAGQAQLLAIKMRNTGEQRQNNLRILEGDSIVVLLIPANNASKSTRGFGKSLLLLNHFYLRLA